MTIPVESLLLPRLTPPVAPVRERRSVTAQAGDASSPRLFQTQHGSSRNNFHEPRFGATGLSCASRAPHPEARWFCSRKGRFAAKNIVEDRFYMTNTHAVVSVASQNRAQAASRKSSRAARAGLSAAVRDQASKKIADTVVRSCWFRRSRIIACYLPVPEEVDTWTLIGRAWRMKKRIFAPVIEKNGTMRFRELTAESELAVNWYGLGEPQHGRTVEPRELDLVITPVVAFDEDCNRIGMGGGYFDRTFSFLRHRKFLFRPKLVGVAFSCQRVEKIAPNPWDIRLFRVIDETS